MNTEKERFIKVHNYSRFKKKLITVNDGDKFRPLEDILAEIEELIEQ